MKRTSIGLIVVLVATLLGAYGLLQIGGGAPVVTTTLASENRVRAVRPRATMTVVGVGEVKAAPNVARIQFGIESTEETAKAAQDANNLVMSQIISELVSMGIKKEDIRTQYFSLYPEYSYNRESGVQTLTGYRAVNEVEVEVRDIDRLGEVIDTAINAGANRIQNVTYGIQDESEFAHQALKIAVENAKAKAEAMADAAGMKIGGILRISDGVMQSDGVRLFGEQVRMMAAADSGSALAPGQVSVKSQVQMVFWIEQ